MTCLLSLTEMIRGALDEGNFACGIFIDLQKAFDTVDHQILLKKVEYYGIRGLANNWFRSYLTNRQQLVSINGFNSVKKVWITVYHRARFWVLFFSHGHVHKKMGDRCTPQKVPYSRKCPFTIQYLFKLHKIFSTYWEYE